jgi:hypothetical protein
MTVLKVTLPESPILVYQLKLQLISQFTILQRISWTSMGIASTNDVHVGPVFRRRLSSEIFIRKSQIRTTGYGNRDGRCAGDTNEKENERKEKVSHFDLAIFKLTSNKQTIDSSHLSTQKIHYLTITVEKL